jgi:hypothetical protein
MEESKHYFFFFFCTQMKKMPDLQKCVTRLKTTIIQVVRSHVVIKKKIVNVLFTI